MMLCNMVALLKSCTSGIAPSSGAHTYASDDQFNHTSGSPFSSRWTYVNKSRDVSQRSRISTWRLWPNQVDAGTFQQHCCGERAGRDIKAGLVHERLLYTHTLLAHSRLDVQHFVYPSECPSCFRAALPHGCRLCVHSSVLHAAFRRGAEVDGFELAPLTGPYAKEHHIGRTDKLYCPPQEVPRDQPCIQERYDEMDEVDRQCEVKDEFRPGDKH